MLYANLHAVGRMVKKRILAIPTASQLGVEGLVLIAITMMAVAVCCVAVWGMFK
jgi:hypothetical protein